MEHISVIVPIYKVEAYLDRCVQSIVDQSYKNLEIILVDDGSPDNCPQMCDQWAKKDSRIRVVHKKNGGLSDARNAGMAIAKGEYIAFVDSDDWIDREYIRFLYQGIKETGAQLAACDIRIVYPESNDSTASPVFSATPHTAEQALATLQRGKGFRAVAWNKLYSRILLVDEHFEYGKYNEDEFFTYRIIAKATHCAYINAPLYNYLQRPGSIMSAFSFKRLDFLDATLQRLAFFKSNYPTLYPHDKAGFCICCANFYLATNSASANEQKKMRSKIKHCRQQVHFTLRELFRYSMHDIIYILGTGFAIRSFCQILKIVRKD